MKLRKRNKLNKKVIVIAAIALAVILIGVVIGIAIASGDSGEQQGDGKAVVRINVSRMPNQTVYYVGDEFNPQGLKLQVVTNAQSETYFVDYNEEMQISGFDSSVPNESLEVRVSYMGYSATFIVQVKEEAQVAPTLERIEVYNFKTEYTLSDWNLSGPDVRGGRIRCIYSDGSVVEDILLKDSYIDSEDVIYMSKPGKTEITIKYSNLETTVEITVTN